MGSDNSGAGVHERSELERRWPEQGSLCEIVARVGVRGALSLLRFFGQAKK